LSAFGRDEARGLSFVSSSEGLGPPMKNQCRVVAFEEGLRFRYYSRDEITRSSRLRCAKVR